MRTLERATRSADVMITGLRARLGRDAGYYATIIFLQANHGCSTIVAMLGLVFMIVSTYVCVCMRSYLISSHASITCIYLTSLNFHYWLPRLFALQSRAVDT